MTFCVPTHIGTVFFDIDGTLLDHRRAADLAVTRFADEHGIMRSSQDNVELWNDLEHKYFHQFEQGKLSFSDQRRARLREFLDADHMSDEDLDVMFDDYYDDYREKWRPFPDVGGALSRCRKAGFSIGVISNGNHVQQLDKLHRIGIDLEDDHVFTSERLGFAKPDRQMYIRACELMDSTPRRSLMIGDDRVADYDGARAAGLSAVLVDREGIGGIGTVTSLDEVEFM